QTVSLGVSGVPSGATAGFSPATITSGGSSTFTLNAGTAAPGTSTLTILGTSATTTHTTTIQLTILGPAAVGITNGGFENGLTGWTSTGATSTSPTSHTGAFSAMAGATTPTNGDSTLAQTFIAPAGAAARGRHQRRRRVRAGGMGCHRPCGDGGELRLPRRDLVRPGRFDQPHQRGLHPGADVHGPGGVHEPDLLVPDDLPRHRQLRL